MTKCLRYEKDLKKINKQLRKEQIDLQATKFIGGLTPEAEEDIQDEIKLREKIIELVNKKREFIKKQLEACMRQS